MEAEVASGNTHKETMVLNGPINVTVPLLGQGIVTDF